MENSNPTPRLVCQQMGLLPVMLSQEGFIATLVVVFLAGEYDIADCQRKGTQSARVKWEKWECSNCKVALPHRCSGSSSNWTFQEYLPVSRPPHQAKDFWSNMLPIGYKDHFISTKSSKVSTSASTPSDPFLQKLSNNQSEASGTKMGWVAFNPSSYRMEGKCQVLSSKRFEISLPLNSEARSIISSLGPPWEGLKQMIYLLNIKNKLRLGN